MEHMTTGAVLGQAGQAAQQERSETSAERLDSAITSMNGIIAYLKDLRTDITSNGEPETSKNGAPIAVPSLSGILSEGPERLHATKQEARELIADIRASLGL